MKELSIAAKTAKQIKKDLKKEFPNTKFTLRSQTFSLGDAVNITWMDGPTRAQVRELTNIYQYTYYHGTADIPQVKYVNISCRRMSPKVENFIIAYLRVNIPECKGKKRDDFVRELNKDMRELIKVIFENTDFSEFELRN
jgi:hypothetical protein